MKSNIYFLAGSFTGAAVSCLLLGIGMVFDPANAQTLTPQDAGKIALASQELAQGQTLAAMAHDADAIAVVRVSVTEYQKTRSFPSSGFALLEVLVAYRGVERGDQLQVNERGLGDSRCYYPELGTWQFEGDRFLVFLKKADNQTWSGKAPSCQLPVLVDDSNQFVLRHPIKGLIVEDLAAVKVVDFADPAARVDASDFTRAKIAELESFYQARRVISEDPLAPPDLVYEYTQGLYLSDVRRMLAADAP